MGNRHGCAAVGCNPARIFVGWHSVPTRSGRSPKPLGYGPAAGHCCRTKVASHGRLLVRPLAVVGGWLLAVASAFAADSGGSPPGPIEIPSLIRLIEQVDAPAREAGVLADVSAAEGQIVQSGALLARIDDTEARAAAERAQAELEIAELNAANTVHVRFAKKAVEVAQAELRRSAESNEKYPKSISETEMDRLRLTVEKGLLEVEQAEQETRIAAVNRRLKDSDHRAAQHRVQRHAIAAPFSGVVVQVARHQGEWVQPGDVVARILRLDRLRAEGFLKLQSWNEGLSGCPARVLVDLPATPGQEFPGKVVFVDPEIDPVNAQVRIWVEVENRGLQLRPGMRARVVLEPPGPKR
jgi:RND family efflux transporter MFP subunit